MFLCMSSIDYYERVQDYLAKNYFQISRFILKYLIQYKTNDKLHVFAQFCYQTIAANISYISCNQ